MSTPNATGRAGAENEAGEVAIHYCGQRLVFRELKGLYSAERGKGRCPFPRAPIPYPTSQHSSSSESSLEKRLFRKGTRPLLRGSVKPKPGDISIVVRQVFVLSLDISKF